VSERTTKRTVGAVAGLTALLYVVAIVVGMKAHNLSLNWWGWWYGTKPFAAWQAPSLASLPEGPVGDSIRSGALLFDETPLYAPANVGGKISCANCHAEGGIQPYASPMVGLPKLFPMFNARAGHMISLKDRIQECFVRSENGKPIDYNGQIMKNLVDYINWLSIPQPGHTKYKGRGLVKLPDLVPDLDHGKQLYYTQCAGCHGNDGQGRLPMFPAVWGADSFNDGAGMNTIAKMAPFIQQNMPQNRMGILTPQQAYDVAGFIHAQPRPAFNKAYKHF
jgi:thiosulfate dehydrogenase